MQTAVNGMVLLMQIFLSTIITLEIYCASNTEKYLYVKTNNVRLRHIYQTTMTSSSIACSAECGSGMHCLSANYQKSTGKCELSPLPRIAIATNSVEDSDWLIMSKNNEWFLVFLGVAGNGVDIYDAWVDDTGNTCTTDNVNCMKLNFTSCTGLHYRNEAVNSWDDLSIKEVKYSLYKNDQEVAFVTFDGEGHSKSSWFTNSGIIASSWTDIQSGIFGVFSIEGWAPARRFFINLQFGGCPLDTGYTVTVSSQLYVCDYDYQDSYPQFFYSNTSSFGFPGRMEGFDKADAITIHIKT